MGIASVNNARLGKARPRDGQSITQGNGTAGASDAVTRSQSDQVVSGTENGQAKSYTYDSVGRLTGTTFGSHNYSYSFGAPTGCTGTYNANSGKNFNRTSQTIDGATTTYCYDNADRLITSSDAKLTNPQYDTHSNMTAIGNTTNTAGALLKVRSMTPTAVKYPLPCLVIVGSV